MILAVHPVTGWASLTWFLVLGVGVGTAIGPLCLFVANPRKTCNLMHLFEHWRIVMSVVLRYDCTVIETQGIRLTVSCTEPIRCRTRQRMATS